MRTVKKKKNCASSTPISANLTQEEIDEIDRNNKIITREKGAIIIKGTIMKKVILETENVI